MEQNQTLVNNTKKQPFFLSLRFSVLSSYYFSLLSNILFIIILFFISDIKFKWIGYTLHLLSILLTISSIRIATNFSLNHLNVYHRYTQFNSTTVLIIIIFYLCVIVFLWTTEPDFSIVISFIFCLLFWGIFHGLSMIIVNAYLRTLEDRPMQKKLNPKTVDKNLKDLMLNGVVDIITH